MLKHENMENPYTPDQFRVGLMRMTEEVFALKIESPEPEEAPLCYFSYYFFNKEFNVTAYYCIEKGRSILGGEQPFVCSWTADGVHLNHGTCSFENHEDFIRCADLFMESKFGMKRVD